MKIIRLLLLFLVFVPAPVSAQGKTPIVLELFGSQGCPSCLVADRFMQTLVEEDKDVLVLACHVTYFDSSQFKDSLSQKFCDGRQAGYLHALPLTQIVTPQFVVNGYDQLTGYRDASTFDENFIRNAVEKARGDWALTNIPLTLRPGFVDISLPPMQLKKVSALWLFAYKREAMGRSYASLSQSAEEKYVNAVTHLVKLLDWDGSSWEMSYPLEDIDADGFAVVAQIENFGRIFAVGNITTSDQE